MDWNQVQDNWNQMTGNSKVKWKLPDDDEPATIAGRQTPPVALLHQRYGGAEAETNTGAFAEMPRAANRLRPVHFIMEFTECVITAVGNEYPSVGSIRPSA